MRNPSFGHTPLLFCSLDYPITSDVKVVSKSEERCEFLSFSVKPRTQWTHEFNLASPFFLSFYNLPWCAPTGGLAGRTLPPSGLAGFVPLGPYSPSFGGR